MAKSQHNLDMKVTNLMLESCFRKESRQNMEDIEQLKIMTPTGDQISLSTIADLELVEGPVALTRQNQQRLVTVSSGIVGRDLGSVVADIEAKLDS